MNYSKKGTGKKQDNITAAGHKKKRVSVFCLKVVIIVCILAVIGIGFLGLKLVKDVISEAPELNTEDVIPTGFMSTVVDADGNVTAELVAAGSNRIYVTLDNVPKDLQHAFVAIEDERFYEHNGIDIVGIARAGVKGITSGHFSQGASTITQQLLKNNVFDGWTTETESERWVRKIQELYLAIQLEQSENIDKDWILENYLNTINMGQNTLGVQAASLRYFGKEVAELNLSECAVLAGITKNPAAYNPISHPEENAKRRKLVLKNMLDQEYISQEEYDEALADNVYDRIQKVNIEETSGSNVTSYFVDALTDVVIEDLQEKAGYSEDDAYKALYSGGLTIYSTQDPEIQAICDEEVNNDKNYDVSRKVSFSYALSIERPDGSIQHYGDQTLLNYYRKKYDNWEWSINFSSEEKAQEKIDEYRAEMLADGGGEVLGERITFIPQPQVAMTVIDQYTGEVVAIVGGRGDKTASKTLNRATDVIRQPGSTFKILAAYAPAIDTEEFTLGTAVDNAPYSYSDDTKRRVNNYNHKHTGLTSVREAIIDSVNVVAVKTLTEIGVQTGVDYLAKFGFTSLTTDDQVQAMALGGVGGVYNIELTAAYAAIANGGVYTEPRLYTKILDHDGNVLIDNTPETSVAIKPTTAWLLTDAMEDVVSKGTGTAAKFSGMSIAGKTGTTSDNRDTLFAGFTPYYSCAVWGGNDDNTVLSGTRFSRTIWKNAMKRIHDELENKKFERPDGIVAVTVCSKTGLRPAEEICEDTHTEYFIKGTAPKKVCDLHVKAKICSESKMLAGEYCPLELVEEKVLLKEATKGTSDIELLLPEETCPIHDEAFHLQQQQPVVPGDPTVPTDPTVPENPIDPGLPEDPVPTE